MSLNTNPVLGVVILARHGDRLGFYQSPTTYTATATTITPLGEFQEYNLGNVLRSIYLNDTSTERVMGLSGGAVVGSQITSVADGGGEGGVIFDSAIALWQGLYPPSALLENTTLANGSTIISPLGGYQYVQINALLPANDVTMEGWTNCNTWTNQTNVFYTSAEFYLKSNASVGFLNQLSESGLVGNRTVSLTNMWNIFDFMNVQSIHNATYAQALNAVGTSILAQVRDLANYHEYGSFTSPTLGGIGNIGGQALLPSLISSLLSFTAPNSTTAASPIKLAHYQLAYKPFLSLFNMTNVAADTTFEYPHGIVDYASVVTMEVRSKMSNATGYDLRFAFRNGSDPGIPVPYKLFGSSSVDYDLATFVSNLAPYGLNSTSEWCQTCSQTSLRGCSAALALSNALVVANSTISSPTSSSSNQFSAVGAGFLGAGVTLLLAVVILGAMKLVGFADFGRGVGRRSSSRGGKVGDRIPLTGRN